MNKLMLILLLLAAPYSHAGEIQVAEAEAAYEEAEALCEKSIQANKEAIRVYKEESSVAEALMSVYKGNVNENDPVPPIIHRVLNKTMSAFEQVVRTNAQTDYACAEARRAYDQLETAEQRID